MTGKLTIDTLRAVAKQLRQASRPTYDFIMPWEALPPRWPDPPPLPLSRAVLHAVRIIPPAPDPVAPLGTLTHAAPVRVFAP